MKLYQFLNIIIRRSFLNSFTNCNNILVYIQLYIYKKLNLQQQNLREAKALMMPYLLFSRLLYCYSWEIIKTRNLYSIVITYLSLYLVQVDIARANTLNPYLRFSIEDQCLLVKSRDASTTRLLDRVRGFKQIASSEFDTSIGANQAPNIGTSSSRGAQEGKEAQLDYTKNRC